eukprot:2453045-Prorocentrum_lima.AAC.1
MRAWRFQEHLQDAGGSRRAPPNGSMWSPLWSFVSHFHPRIADACRPSKHPSTSLLGSDWMKA